jgi:hypothetical protein
VPRYLPARVWSFDSSSVIHRQLSPHVQPSFRTHDRPLHSSTDKRSKVCLFYRSSVVCLWLYKKRAPIVKVRPQPKHRVEQAIDLHQTSNQPPQ